MRVPARHRPGAEGTKRAEGTKQPSLVTLSRLLAAADLELQIQLASYDDHDDVIDTRRAALTGQQRAAADAAFTRTSEVLAAASERAGKDRLLPAPAAGSAVP